MGNSQHVYQWCVANLVKCAKTNELQNQWEEPGFCALPVEDGWYAVLCKFTAKTRPVLTHRECKLIIFFRTVKAAHTTCTHVSQAVPNPQKLTFTVEMPNHVCSVSQQKTSLSRVYEDSDRQTESRGYFRWVVCIKVAKVKKMLNKKQWTSGFVSHIFI